MTIQLLMNLVGLALDIIGVLLLFKYGLPSDLNKKGYIFKVLEQVDNHEVEKYKRYDKISKIALTLLILGFLMQAFSTILQAIC